MALTALSYKIDEASRNFWRTGNPNYKKEWYRLINIFYKINRRKAKQK